MMDEEQLHQDVKVVGVGAVIVAILLLALLVQFSWNIGLVGALTAVGVTSVVGISYWTALGLTTLLALVRAWFIPVRRQVHGLGTQVFVSRGETTEDADG